MKDLITIFLLSLIFIACKKSKTTNELVGKWQQLRAIAQYTNPFTQNIQYDTLTVSNPAVEFKGNGGFFANTIQEGTYSILNDSTFIIKPLNYIISSTTYTYAITAGGSDRLKIRRKGINGEQIQIADPNTQACSHIAIYSLSLQNIKNSNHVLIQVVLFSKCANVRMCE